MAQLLVISSSPAAMDGDKVILDRKFCEGMQFYCSGWDGPVRCLMRAHNGDFPFREAYDPAALPFELQILDQDQPIETSHLGQADVILCSGDNPAYLHLAGLVRRHPAKLVYIIENIFQTRRKITTLDPTRSWPRKIYSILWDARQELRRRRAFPLAAGLQANGYPAAEDYGRINPNTMRYLDNRVSTALMVTPAEMEARTARLASDAPVRLIHSGRLEPIKGSQHLVAIARHLAEAGHDFILDIFGTGSLEEAIRRDAAAADLSDQIVLHGSVDFETELMPYARAKGDLYLSCHLQSDPSCTYLESMGCGLPVAGYANRMWAALRDDANAGWTVPLGDWQALARELDRLLQNRAEIARNALAAGDFAAAHSFEAEFSRRIAHLQALADPK